MSKRKSQLEKDIAFCIDECEMDDEQIGDMLRACESLGGMSVEYFCEEFVFICEDVDVMKYHDTDYLNIAEFNAMHWDTNHPGGHIS